MENKTQGLRKLIQLRQIIIGSFEILPNKLMKTISKWLWNGKKTFNAMANRMANQLCEQNISINAAVIMPYWQNERVEETVQMYISQ